jgi:hypothetical protein
MRKTIIILAALQSAVCLGDSLTLKTGENIDGTYLGGSARAIKMEVNGQVQNFDISTVAGVQFNPGPSGPPAGGPPPQGQYSSSGNQNQGQNNAQNNAGPGAAGYTLPAGTQFTIRMIDSVDSESSRLGDTFRASLDEPIMSNGQTLVPRGGDVNIKLVEDQASGKISGKAILKLVVTQIRINDRFVDVVTQDVVKESGSRGAKSAGVIGGAAAVGAIIGGIAGGGRGAAIGAGSGAAVGTGAQVLTKGQRVKIPSETRLTFTLSYDVRI